MKRYTLLSIFFIFSLVAALALGNPLPAATAAPNHANLAELTQSAQANGSLSVIVMLNTPFVAEASLADADAVAAQRAALLQTQTAVLSGLNGGYEPASVKTYTFIPAMALTVTPAGLAALAADPTVLNIQEDLPLPADLSQSVPMIGAPTVWAAGYSGLGQTVAILDTGVDKNHVFLTGKVVSEACYSSNNATYSSVSLCPGQAASSIAPGSALPYGTGICPSGKCDHGTHVAGIVAGKDPGGASATGFSGVAKDATLIAIQVFSKFPGTYCSGGVPCALTFTSDQIYGLQRVYDLRTTYAIASVNMSLGGGSYTSYCDSIDSWATAEKAAIDTLRGVNIATVIASGNNGYTTSISFPACISSAVSVGAVGDGTPGATYGALDVVTAYSNAASILKLLAPGSLITSSIPYGSYADYNGTSMATPHVAGAWAVLKSKYPTATVTNVLNTFIATGKPITDTRSGAGSLVKPRIRLDQAALGSYSISGKVATSGSVGIAGVTVSTNSGLNTTTTDASGNYTLTGLIEGTYIVTPSKLEYTFNPVSTSVTVGPSKTGINFTGTQATYTVTGQVTLSGGGPLSGVSMSDGAGHTATTNASGNYTLTGLVAGLYTITPTKAEYTFAPVSLPVSVGPNATAINFVATQNTYTISGRVTVTGGYPVAGATLTATGGRTATSDTFGYYTITGLVANTYTITPTKTGYTAFTPSTRSVTVGASKTGIDFVGTTPLYTVTGKVTTDGVTGIPGVMVVDNLGRSSITDASGGYTLTNMPAASYTLVAVKAGYLFSPTGNAITVSGPMTNVNFLGAVGGKWLFFPGVFK